MTNFNTVFKMHIKPAENNYCTGDCITLASNVRFIFGDDTIQILGKDINLVYSRNSIGRLEAEIISLVVYP